MLKPPNPGSRAAIDQGCTCPILDNNHGLGLGKDENGETLFWHSFGCPIHFRPEEDPNSTVDKRRRREHLRCSHCPPNRMENASRRPKHGVKKPRRRRT